MLQTKNVNFALFLLSIVGSAWAVEVDICRPNPQNATGLINCINFANSTTDDTIVDLGGAIYTLDAINNSAHGNNGLPEIVPVSTGGRLMVINGTIKRDVNSGLNFRFFYVQPNANLILFK